MKRVKIVRLTEKGGATRGCLLIDDEMICATLEEPWRDNTPKISCIPAGKYRLKRVRSFKFGETYEVCNVPGRSLIRVHYGNDTDDTEGCPLLGMKWGTIDGKPAILKSVNAFNLFMQVMGQDQEAELEIVKAY